jgi:hypothetical protein
MRTVLAPFKTTVVGDADGRVFGSVTWSRSPRGWLFGVAVGAVAAVAGFAGVGAG